jgi:SAM-dependent methyltransferase
MTKELIIGCGQRKTHNLSGQPYQNPTTLDNNPTHNPDILHDLEHLPLPFPTDTFDEIHAYHTLEHTGQQGDHIFFFKQFQDFWRILKPLGTIHIITPHYTSPWAWGDPGHKRIISKQTLIFLDQNTYKQIGKTAMTDYRNIYQGNLKHIWHEVTKDGCEYNVLEAVK